MSKFTSEMIDDYASKLLIGLTDSEKEMIISEFDEIDKTMDSLNEIDGLDKIEPQSFPFDMEIEDLREDEDIIEEIDIDTLLSNCDRTEGREIEVPKVVG